MRRRSIKLLIGAALSCGAMFGNVAISYQGGSVPPAGTPYLAYLNGSLNPSIVVCDDSGDHISSPETWQATEVSLYSLVNASSNSAILGTNFGLSLENDVASYNSTNHTNLSAQTVATEIYEAVGYLVLKLVNSPSDPSDLQNAIWDLTKDTGLADIYNLQLGSSASKGWGNADAGFTAQALANYGSLTTTQQKDLEILTPIAGTQSNPYSGSNPNGNKLPQEFWTVAPEPGTYAMFGIGLTLLSLGTFRRARKSR